ncbi:SdpI family protein [Lacticaseibacillus brantae]|uniref:Uncharacterized protein n=1 Tax=Lacticaseibacillus brantae DSM 23927 TaxID=1423727 RepID=A0A0R2B2M0_9LACO|nr:SdpI family protein [Lacticaseibacillus brantae]KRM72994.1 hypothetical protein FC34_GL000710 [Lacticaseibacillus brantae DSM 23927]
MILLFAGGIQIVIGLSFLILPARKPSSLYGYTSYLASVNETGFHLAQKWARQTLLLTGIVLVLAGWAIRCLQWDKFFILWLFIAVLSFLPVFVQTETRLKKYLISIDELPVDYVDPDEALKNRGRRRH